MLVARNPVQRMHKYAIRVYFLMPHTNTKFNPTASMHLFFKEMLNYDSTITITNPTDDNQIQLATDAVPVLEAEFKKFFTFTNNTCPTGTKPHIIIGCHMMSDCTMCKIKFEPTTTKKFMDWLVKEQIFIESYSLGIVKMATIGYLMKLHPLLTNRTALKPLLLDLLSDIVMDPTLACELDPSLMMQQTDAMSNGDMFVPEPPPFEIYKTKICHGCNNDRIETDILRIKCTVEKGRLHRRVSLVGWYLVVDPGG